MLEDVTVREGGTAQFTCFTPSRLRHARKDSSDHVTVHWTFNGRRLDLDIELDPSMDSSTPGYGALPGRRLAAYSSPPRHRLLVHRARREDEGRYSCVTSRGEELVEAAGTLTVQR